MYSFAQRSDTKVFDEILYPNFLVATGSKRPDREATLDLMDSDGLRVIQETILGVSNHKVLFFKNIANHLVGLDHDFLDQVKNVFLIRDPREMILSYAEVIEQPTMLDLAVEQQYKCFKKLQESGKPALLIDSKELLLNPAKVLSELCDGLGIPWDPNMLAWEAGPRAEDGPWAKYWYEGVHKSTGFKKYNPKQGELSANLEALYHRCLPLYEYLRAFSLLA